MEHGNREKMILIAEVSGMMNQGSEKLVMIWDPGTGVRVEKVTGVTKTNICSQENSWTMAAIGLIMIMMLVHDPGKERVV